jgi:tetratricopeptide (TPR) repeat protein/O-antigen ligase
MTSRHKRSRGSRRRSRTVAENALSLTLLLGVVGTLLVFGGATPWSRVWAGLSTATALVCVLAMRPEHVRAGGAALRVALAGGLLMLGVLGGFVPIPGFLQGLVAPGWEEARGSGHLLASADPVASLDVFFKLATLTAVGFCTAIWAGRSRARRYGWYVVYAVAVGIVALGLAFALRGSHAYFGVNVGGRMRFFAPFVNPNHFGSFICLVYPFMAGRALSKREGEVPQAVGALCAFLLLGAVVYAGSTGPIVVVTVQTVALIWYERKIPLWAITGGAMLSGVAGILAVSLLDLQGILDLHGRLATWRSSAWMWLDHWLFGTGAGTYGDELLPYRTDRTPEFWGYAHNDWLEWMVTTGLFGTVMLLAALFVLRPRPRQAGQGGRYAQLGIAGLCLHAALDFPFQLVGLCMLAAAIIGWRMAIYDRYGRSSLMVVRTVAALLLVTQLLGAGYAYRAHTVETVTEFLAKSPRGSSWHELAMGSLAWWSPRSPELQVERAIKAMRQGRDDEAVELLADLEDRYRGRGLMLATVAEIHAVRGDPRAIELVERAVERSPSDWRLWEIRARIISRLEPGDAPMAWRDALRRGVPRALREGWAVLPVGIYWLDAMADRPAAKLRQLGRFLYERGDEEAAFLAYQQAQQRDPSTYDLTHARLLIEYAPEQAGTFLDDAMEWGRRDRRIERLRAENLENQGDFAAAMEAWEDLAKTDTDARYRFVRLVRQEQGPAVALRELARAQVGGEELSTDAVFLEAELHAALGDSAACKSTLTAAGLLDRNKTKKRARKAMEACRATDGER